MAKQLNQQFHVMSLINNDKAYRSIIEQAIFEWWKYNKGAEKLRLYNGRDASGNPIGLTKKREYKGKIYNYKRGRNKNIINFYETGAFQKTLGISFNKDNSITYTSNYTGTRSGFEPYPLLDAWTQEYGDNIFRPSDRRVPEMLEYFIEPALQKQVDKAIEWLNSEL